MNRIHALLAMTLLATAIPAAAIAATPATPAAPEPSLPALEDKPRWELGVGAGYVDGFDYPASANPNRTAIALPYFVYRSAVVRLGGGGLQAIALENPRIKLDLSIGGSLSASSDGNTVRDGMPDLDYLVEVGPQVTVLVSTRDHPGYGRSQLSWSAKLRGVVSTDFGAVDGQGFVFETGVRFSQRGLFGGQVDLLAALNATATTEDLQDYFYEVAERFATPERPRFDAEAGYLGSELLLGSVYRPLPSLRLFAGVVFGRYAGAANEDSPLFETRSTTSTAVGLVWTLKTSRKNVPVLVTD